MLLSLRAHANTYILINLMWESILCLNVSFLLQRHVYTDPLSLSSS